MCENIYTYTLIAHKGGMTNAFCAYTLLENLTDDGIAQLCLCVTKCSTISLYLTNFTSRRLFNSVIHHIEERNLPKLF